MTPRPSRDWISPRGQAAIDQVLSLLALVFVFYVLRALVLG